VLPPETAGSECWSPAEFEAHGARVLHWIADYLSRPQDYPVRPRVRPGDVRKKLPRTPPAAPEPLDRILDDFRSILVPANTHWNHPGFMAYFSSSGSMPGILAEALSAALNVNGMLWESSPAATELEETTTDWLRQLLGLPPRYRGVIHDTASVSNLVALLAARHRVRDVRKKGLAGLPPLRLYTSKEAHSSVDKAAIALGIGLDGVRRIPCDGRFRMDPRALEKAVQEDAAAGLRPFAVAATAGTTSTTSVDPLESIAAVCRRHRLWFHVDAAHAGAASILPEMRRHFQGWEKADSLVVNPHKWLFAPIDLSVLFLRDRESLREALSIVPDYLKPTETVATTNFMEYGLALGRRFRSLKLWFVIRSYGREGLRRRLRRHLRMGRAFGRWIARSELFERAAPVPFSTVCFRCVPPGDSRPDAEIDRLNRELLDRVNRSGEIYLSSTRLEGRFTLRLSVGNLRTTERHVRRAQEILDGEARRLLRKRRWLPTATSSA
jgi:aromatic-L-amino-acid decarboxylase